LPEIQFQPVLLKHSEPCAAEPSEATWLEDLVREEEALAAITSVPEPAGYSEPAPDNAAPTGNQPPLPADKVWVFGQSATGTPSDSDESSDSLAGAGFENPFAAFSLGDISFAEPPRPSSQGAVPDRADAAIDGTADATTLIPRLKQVSLPAGFDRRLPAPAPASLARLRSWLHDDALPEAS
jgi:hypothetical protein